MTFTIYINYIIINLVCFIDNSHFIYIIFHLG